LGALAHANSIEQEFVDPPRIARPIGWWHWINGNVSKEGIRADMEAAIKAGMGGLHMFDTSLYQPPGPVRYGTDNWHEHVRYAIETAEELGLELGVMNCPGWSMSGGPWITPEKSMKMIVWTETPVSGGKPFAGALAQPKTNKDFYRDVVVLAVPADPKDTAAAPSITSSVEGLDLVPLGDGDAKTGVKFPEGKAHTVVFTYPQPTSRRLLKIDVAPPGTQLKYLGLIQVSDDGKKWRTIRNFNESTGTAQTGRGLFVPFEPTKATQFRVQFSADASRQPYPLRVGGLSLSSAARIDEINTKIGIEKLQGDPRTTGTNTSDPDAIPAAKVLNLTEHFKDGKLSWTAPAEGDWVVLRFGYTATGSTNHPAVDEGHGLESDKFDPEVAKFHFDKALGRLIKEAGPHAGKTLNAMLADSWEAGPQNWTATFPALFKQQRGYDIIPMLPCVTGRVVGSLAESEAFLNDFRLTLGQLIAQHYGTLRELANRHGMKFYAEAYAGFLDEFSAGEAVDVPMAEFWIHTYSKSCQRATSIAHTTGKPIVAAESFTSRPPDGRWQDTLASLKPIGDLALAYGINRMCFHSYIHQPRNDVAPGFTHSRYGTHFGRHNTWWPQATDFVWYLARAQYLLQKGRDSRDVLLLRHDDLERNDFADYLKTPQGYKWDLLAARQLLGATVENGRIKLAAGTSYAVLVLPNRWSTSVAVLKQLDKLVNDGAVVVGPAPVATVGLIDLRNNLAEWNGLVKKLWSDSSDKRVRVARSLDEVLEGSGVKPDFAFTSEAEGATIEFIHRTDENVDAYFLTNQTGKPVVITADFRAGSRRPELWDAMTGTVAKARSFEAANGCVRLPLALDAGGSIFVVFREPLSDNWITSITRDGGKEVANDAALASNDRSFVATEPGSYVVRFVDGREHRANVDSIPSSVEVPGPWQVAFQERRGAPASIQLDRLVSLSKHAESGVKYFSGTATYTTTVNVAWASRPSFPRSGSAE
ncbi:MAG: glycosyl hydrolase, partial [Tepidisphaeraceae bacterium]